MAILAILEPDSTSIHFVKSRAKLAFRPVELDPLTCPQHSVLVLLDESIGFHELG
jgi:hypothetical protein